MRFALIAEAFFNISGAIVFLLCPEWCLSYVIQSSNTSTIPPSTATFLQIYSCLVLALSLPIIQCIPETPGVAARRAMIFWTLGAGELFIIGLLLWKAQDPEASGFTSRALIQAAGALVPYLIWRIWALWVDPELLGEGEGGLQKKKT